MGGIWGCPMPRLYPSLARLALVRAGRASQAAGRLEDDGDEALGGGQGADGGGVEPAGGDAAREEVVELLAEQALLCAQRPLLHPPPAVPPVCPPQPPQPRPQTRTQPRLQTRTPAPTTTPAPAAPPRCERPAVGGGSRAGAVAAGRAGRGPPEPPRRLPAPAPTPCAPAPACATARPPRWLEGVGGRTCGEGEPDGADGVYDGLGDGGAADAVQPRERLPRAA